MLIPSRSSSTRTKFALTFAGLFVYSFLSSHQVVLHLKSLRTTNLGDEEWQTENPHSAGEDQGLVYSKRPGLALATGASLSDEKEEELCQEDSDAIAEWQRYRAPLFIQIGAQKAGTSALATYFVQHPQIRIRYKELHFFDKHIAIHNGTISRKDNLSRYARYFQFNPLLQMNSSNLVSFESTPSYIFYSHRTPQRLLCVLPWIQLLAVLRNPIERLESHYRMLINMHTKRRISLESLEDLVERDIEILHETGVLYHTLDVSAGSRQPLFDCWDRYLQRVDGQMALVGRGLYILQLLQYFFVFEQHGKSWKQDMLVLEAGGIQGSQTQDGFNRIMDFVGLPNFNLSDTSPKHVTTGGNKTAALFYNDTESPSALSRDLRRHLQELYRPFNNHLFSFLGWKDVQWS